MSVVNGLWVGQLEPLQLLSIHSFLKQGHTYVLWIYPNIDKHLIPTNIPNNVLIRDANTILDKKYIFKHWSGNYATFADIFRYKLLYEQGGWWVDLDIVCLRPLPKVEYFFGGERTKLTGAFKRSYTHSFWIGLMRFPKKNHLLKKIYSEMIHKIDDFKSIDKNIPFFYGQRKLGLELKKKYGNDFLFTKNKVHVDFFNPFSPHDMLDFYKENTGKCCKRWGWGEMSVSTILQKSYTIHLYNTIIKKLNTTHKKEMYLLNILQNRVYT